MGVWKRLQRVGKKAAKFQFNISYHDLCVECSKEKWQPDKLCVNWTRRNRNIRTQIHDWNTNLSDTKTGHIDWRLPENVTSTITLYKEARDTEFEDKDWTFIVETVDKNAKKKAIASTKMNMKHFATLSACPRHVDLELKPLSDKYKRVTLSLTISCSLVKEGLATDDDMMSLASLMSYGGASGALDDSSDVGNLADFEGLETPVSSFASFTAQMGQFLDHKPDPTRTKHEMAEGGGDTASLTNDDDSSYVRRPMYIGTPPSTPPELRKLPRPITPPLDNVTEGQQHLSASPNCKRNMRFSPPRENTASNKLKEKVKGETKSGNTDLFTWAKDITSSYKGIKVTNYNTSWRNGMAFCAIIHHYKPDLIDYDALDSRQIKENNRIAFDAGAKLGITRVIEPSDMVVMKIPDKLQVMTYLHELRTYFTGEEIIAQPTKPSTACKLSAAKILTGEIPYHPIKSAVAEYSGTDLNRLVPTRYADEELPLHRYRERTTPTPDRASPKQSSLESNISLTNKASSPPPKPPRNHVPQSLTSLVPKPKLMTEQELRNPFDSDSDEGDDPYADPYAAELNSALGDHPLTPDKTTSVADAKDNMSSRKVAVSCNASSRFVANTSDESAIKCDNKMLSSPGEEKLSVLAESKPTEDLRMRARHLIEQEKAKRLAKESSPLATDERHKALKFRAQKILEQFKKGQSKRNKKVAAIGKKIEVHQFACNVTTHAVSSSEHSELSKLHTDDPLPCADSGQGDLSFAPTDGSSGLTRLMLSRPHLAVALAQSSQTYRQSTDQKFQEQQQKVISEDHEQDVEREQVEEQTCMEFLNASEYVSYELAELELEQADIDRQANRLEVRLRRAMHTGNTEREEALMQQWFALVNQKNALIRRQEELNILEKEEDLNRRYEMLNRELRYLMHLDDWEKSALQKEKEQMLLDELINVVNKRDQLVNALDEQQISLEQDDATEAELRNRSFQKEEKQCLIQ